MFQATCAACQTKGEISANSGSFQVRGKYNSFPAYKCTACGVGLFVSNPGRAMLTKRAKMVVIPAASWALMSEQWKQMFPED
jgi:hypothetical protein